jgi:hypothetical protein
LRSSPGLRTAAIAKATAAQRSTTDERLNRLQAKGLIERDAPAPGYERPPDRRGDRRFARARPSAQCERWIKPLVVYDFRGVEERR